MQNQPLTSILFQLMCRLRFSKQPSRFGRNGFGMAVLGAIVLTAQAVSAAALTDWRYDAATNQLEMTVKEGTTPKYFVMAQPARIVVDLPDTEMGEVKSKESFSGVVSQVRVSQFQPGITRIVLELAPDVELAAGQVKLETKGDRLVLRPLVATATTATKPVAKTQASTSKTAISKAESALPPPPAVETVTPPAAASVSPAPPPASPVPASPVPSASPNLSLPSAIGADVSPVTTEPTVSVPPPSASVPAPFPTKPSESAGQTIAQLPAEATTPLPPETVLPSSGSVIEPGNAVPIAVPPPVALPASSPEIVIEAPRAKPAPASTVVPTLEIPSTVRSVPATNAPQVTVPTFSPTAPTANTQAIPPLVTPPPMAVPALAPMSSKPTVQPPVSSVIQVSGSQVSERVFQAPPPTSLPSSAAPAPVKAQPPNSWVMQSSGMPAPGIGSVPPAGIASPAAIAPSAPPPSLATAPPTLTKVTPPPNSWVMQSSNLSQPSLTRSLQPPPASSVIQPSLIQPPAVQSISLNNVPPVSSVMQPSTMPPIATSPITTSPTLTTETPTVSVPPLQSSSQTAAPTVSVPPLQPTGSATLAATPASNLSANSSVVEFGKPLPTAGAVSLNTVPKGLPPSSSFGIQPSGAVQSANPAIALATGTLLALSYPGAAEVQLNAAGARQDMMVLQTEVRDASGNVVFPQGSYVMGQFETTGAGSKFVTSSIQRGDRIVPFYAESEPLAGGNREINASSMAIYSGAGALAGGLVSRFSGWGILLGGAAGAATNFLTTPKPTTIQPGQVIQVRMTRDVPY
ncbi:MAG: AMIN domain-containing protein [Leptolyngbyaceae cyanobacterium bins.302]|nr:AMIN domain-containing protein [Leptolyngbyaceae cyanobacterium bins.302]